MLSEEVAPTASASVSAGPTLRRAAAGNMILAFVLLVEEARSVWATPTATDSEWS